MLSRAASRLAVRSAALPKARRSSNFSSPIRNFQSSARNSLSNTAWRSVGVLAGVAGATYALYELNPKMLSLPVVHAEAPPSPASLGTYLDPTTKTPFPTTLVSPDGVKLRLVGTGVRTVSFLSIRVYAVGFYVSEKEFEAARSGRLEGWKGYTPERLLAPHTIPVEEQQSQPVGEALIDNLLEKADAAVVIIPLRNTSLPHLRDGFSRALVARMKVPSVAAAFDEQVSERTGAALVEFKSFFPNGKLASGAPMEVYYSAPNRSILFQIRDASIDKAPAQVLGTMKDGLLSRELMVSYFSNTAAPSEELKKSVAMGFAGEPR
ncbi:chalcone isomerase domain-containing protein [Sporobolomyces salmoneus]|uniref:chalcone isomerase domain-containing protein n=1 Tax=Sporobolomyces salmoneus TaxID=183962 RepID=UPI00317CD1B2